MEFGLNLYSIRNLLKTEEGFLDTTHKLCEMGYDCMQFSGMPFDADMITRVSRESGLPVVLTHVPMDRILDDTDALMEEHSRFGCTRIGLGMMAVKYMTDESEFKSMVERLERAAQKMSENGFSFFYHNHHYEFRRTGDITLMEYMLQNAPHINFTFDTYWAQYGGVGVLDYVKKLNGRIECVHLKDYMVNFSTNAEGKLSVAPLYAPVGDGNINFKEIIPEMQKSGTKYFIVEQDNATDLPDPLGQVERSIKYLKKLKSKGDI